LVVEVSMTFVSVGKCDIEKFNGRINFGLWQTQVKNVLVQFRLHNANSSQMS